ncbi:MAG: MFS transporter, partial [Clostridia bacterium]|nr:MFS transporter [Clostridia bacterium]
ALSMIYGPMTKVVSENTELVYATRCSLGYTFASFIGSPFAGILAALFVWQGVFAAGSGILIMMGTVCFLVFTLFERKKIIEYGKYQKPKAKGNVGGIKVLIRHQIIKFTLISILTGVVRTTVVFWLPTYISEYLGFSPDRSALIFTVATFVISFAAFVAIFVYERLHRNMDLVILLAFSTSAVCFIAVYLLKQPVLNVIFIVLAIMASNSAATMLWSRYCPSLRDTGMVSGATGFLDFVSYMAAAASSKLFANAVSSIGWGNLILIWFGLMILGVVVALPYRKFLGKKETCPKQ